MRLPMVRRVVPDINIHGLYLEAQWGEYRRDKNLITVVDGVPFLPTFIHELIHWGIYLLPERLWFLHDILHGFYRPLGEKPE